MAKKTERQKKLDRNSRVINFEESRRERQERAERSGAGGADTPKRRKKKRVKINYVRLVFVLLVVGVVLYLAFSAFRVANLDRQRQELEKKESLLAQERERLALRLQHASSGFNIETQARRRLKMIKENEFLYVFNTGEDQLREDMKKAMEGEDTAENGGEGN